MPREELDKTSREELDKTPKEEPQSNITTAPSAQAPFAQAPPAQAPSVQAPPVQAPSAQAPSAQAPSAQAPLASPSSLTKAKEPRQPSSYKPPQPTQQSLPAATASTLPPVTAPTLPSLPPAQYLHPSTANTNPNMQLHIDQPTYDPCLPQNKTPIKAEQNELHKAKPIAKEHKQPMASFNLPFTAQSLAATWEKEHPS